jgi:hypothetical protein
VTASVTNAGADYGIQIVGKVLPFNGEIDEWNQVLFDVILGDTLDSFDSPWDDTTLDSREQITNDTGGGGVVSNNPDMGLGTWQYMRTLEFKARANRGQLNQTEHPVVALPNYIVESSTYDVYTLTYMPKEASKNLNQQRDIPQVLYIALPAGANAARALLEGFMNPYLNAVGFPSVNL